MVKTQTKFGISTKDTKTIQNIVSRCPESLYFKLPIFIKKGITDITVNHYIYMGYLIGQIDATEKTRLKIITNFQPCQRQN